ncbi:TRIC cation channel family protein [Brachybacterium sp. EF45031]|nr:TRIC cation channel family protein [Brachybacterium sillae]
MGITGGGIAARLNFDPVGFAVVGIVSGLGGGILRDVILDRGIPAAFDGPWYFVCSLLGAGFAFLITSEGRALNHLMVVLDAIALGLWAATGTAKSLATGLDMLPALLLGVLSAVGGGAIRDVMVGRIPVIFGGGPLYATSALVASVATWAVAALRLDPAWVIAAAALGTALALVSAWRRWTLPGRADSLVTLSPAQVATLIKRARWAERRKLARQAREMVAEEAAADQVDAASPSADR